MKCQIPEISWHNRDPVLSVDIQPVVDDKVRLASAGSDTHVLIWYLTQDKQDGVVKLDLVTDLARHQRAVNCVRWSPSGEYLASSDDESVIFIWRQKPETETLNIFDKDDASDQDKETWINFKILRGHMEDVYDLSWSSNSNFLISGSIDNTAIVWDVQKGKSQAILQDHKGFVQGVAWDPLNKYLATLSTDRIFRIFDVHTKKVVNRCCKSLLPVTKESPFHEKQIRLFHDDTLQTFFRRLSFSPDGNLIVVPSGVADMEGSNDKPLNTTYIFTRNSLKAPSIVLPSPDQFTIAVKFCPMLFELKPNKKKPVIPLPYRMIFAVATKSSVYLYDTQQKIPFGLISNIHYTRLTDLAWSNDGTILLVSSTDGYCSIVQFNENELGVQYKEKSIAEIIKENTPREKEKKKDKSKNSESRMNASQVPQKIAVKRKPKVAVEQKENKPEPEVVKEPTSTVPEKKEENMDVDKVETMSPPKIPDTVSETIKELIPIDKIIRSDEKFESPKKNDSPVTPIPIRKHPRTVTTPSEENSKKTTPTKQSEEPPANTITPTRKLNKQSKTPTPIAVRRKPRVLQPQPVAKDAKNIQSSPLKEEENGVWPIDESVKPLTTNNEKPVVIPTTSEGHKTPKTPRRVELITISTPKSKKKLDN